MIHVLATLSVAPGRRDDLLALFTKLSPAVLAEEGCIEYGTAVDVDTPYVRQGLQEPVRNDVVVVVEKWASIAALEAHLAAPHMEAFRTETSEIVTQLSLQVLDPA